MMNSLIANSRLSLISLLIMTGLSICLSGTWQPVSAQPSKGEAPSPKEIARLKSALALDTILKALRSDKAGQEEKVQATMQAVKERSVSFVLTPGTESQLTEAGATKPLLDLIRKEAAKLAGTPAYFRNLGDTSLNVGDRFFRLGESFRSQKNEEEAKKNYDEAKTNYDEAILNYTKAIEFDLTDKFAYNNRGHCYAFSKRYDEAIADFTRAIELDPTDSRAYFNRAVTFDNRGVANKAKDDFEKAIADYTKAIELDPKYTAAYRLRSEDYQMMGRKELADADKRMIEQIKTGKPPSP